jgi:outer membrane protein TolC
MLDLRISQTAAFFMMPCLILLCILFLFPGNLPARPRPLSLDEALTLAGRQSLDALIARNLSLYAYWQYRNYRADLLPNIVLQGNLPQINRSLNTYQRENGSYGFVKNNSITENLSLSISQNIPFTGGNIALQSALQRIDQLGENKTTGYLSVPFSLTLTQPLFSPKTLHWAMRIEPERYREAQQQYQADIENIYIKTIRHYFDLLLAQTNTDIATINQTNAAKLHNIAQGKKAIGLISDNDLLQLELKKINAEAELISARQTCENKMLTLRNFLRMDNSETLIPILPETAFNIDITPQQVLHLAAQNNPLNHTVKRRLMEAHRKIDEAKAHRGFTADLNLSLGNTGSDPALPESYRNLQNREIATLSIRIPLLDWGKGKGRIKLAESEQQVVKSQIQQTQLNFEQDIALSVSQFRDQAQLLTLAQHADSIAQLRYQTAFQTFVAGTINVLDINNAQIERDNARRKYINELYLSWLCYYNLRQITLYDFQRRVNILHPEINTTK